MTKSRSLLISATWQSWPHGDGRPIALRPRLSTGLPLSVDFFPHCMLSVPNLAENDGAVRLGVYSTGVGEALRATLRSLVRVPPASSYCGESKSYMPLTTERIRLTLSQAGCLAGIKTPRPGDQIIWPGIKLFSRDEDFPARIKTFCRGLRFSAGNKTFRQK